MFGDQQQKKKGLKSRVLELVDIFIQATVEHTGKKNEFNLLEPQVEHYQCFTLPRRIV